MSYLLGIITPKLLTMNIDKVVGFRVYYQECYNLKQAYLTLKRGTIDNKALDHPIGDQVWFWYEVEDKEKYLESIKDAYCFTYKDRATKKPLTDFLFDFDRKTLEHYKDAISD